MSTDNFKIQIRKGLLEFCVLQIISRGEVYTSDIIDELKKSEIIVVEGTLYPLLNRLKASGYVDYKWKESNQGPPCKINALSLETLLPYLSQSTVKSQQQHILRD